MLKTNAHRLSRSSVILIALFILIFLSGGLDKISSYTVWAGFLLCLFMSVGSLILSLLSIVGNWIRITPYMTALFSVFLILFTIFIYLLPEAGIPPMIPLIFE